MTNKTAIEQYEQRLAEARALLEKIAERLEAHSARAHARPHDWGFVGSLGEVVELLGEAERIIR